MDALRGVEFVTSVADLSTLPPEQGAEVAFAGRSNAGKSSALNALTQRQRMAFVSKTPGRTQLINFFRVGADGFLVDLPGYGYAAVPDATRTKWESLVGGYLRTRECLRGVLLIMDARHPMKPLDYRFIEWLRPAGIPLHVLLSKCDKLSKAEAASTLQAVSAILNHEYDHCSVQLFSSLRKIGIVEAAAKIQEWLGRPDIKKPPVKGE